VQIHPTLHGLLPTNVRGKLLKSIWRRIKSPPFRKLSIVIAEKVIVANVEIGWNPNDFGSNQIFGFNQVKDVVGGKS